MGTVTVEMTFGDCIAINTEGRIDNNAERAFTRGQCHALALALHRLTGWELYGLYDAADHRTKGGTPGHTVVRMPDGDYLDIKGNNALENWREYYKAKPYAVTEAQVLGFEHKDYVSPNVDAAMPYAVTLFAKYGTGQNAMRIPYAPAIPTLTGKQLRFPFAR